MSLRCGLLAAISAVTVLSHGAYALTLAANSSSVITRLDPSDPSLAGNVVFQSSVAYYDVIYVPGWNPKGDSHLLYIGDVQVKAVKLASSGTLDFYYDVVPTEGYGVEEFTLRGFGSPASLDVDIVGNSYLSPGFSVWGAYSLDNGGQGNLNVTNYGNSVVVHTDLTSVEVLPGGKIDLIMGPVFNVGPGVTGLTIDVPNLTGVPAPTPEPTSLMLLPLAVAGLAVRFRRG